MTQQPPSLPNLIQRRLGRRLVLDSGVTSNSKSTSIATARQVTSYSPNSIRSTVTIATTRSSIGNQRILHQEKKSITHKNSHRFLSVGTWILALLLLQTATRTTVEGFCVVPGRSLASAASSSSSSPNVATPSGYSVPTALNVMSSFNNNNFDDGEANRDEEDTQLFHEFAASAVDLSSAHVSSDGILTGTWARLSGRNVHRTLVMAK
jgi:hypothetical protein